MSERLDRFPTPILTVLLMLLAPAWTSLAAAQGGPSEPTAEALEAFFAEALPPLLEAHDVPGAAVAVVVGDEVRWAEGYGLARVEGNVEATADTPFGVGSVAKTVTWTLLMGAVERDEVALDDAVGPLVERDLSSGGYDAPITLEHLMTHTAGFEDTPVVGLFRQRAEDLPTLREALWTRAPARVRPPGREAAYSNWGTALAGHALERIEERPFAEIAERWLFAPLGMDGASFRQPRPEAIEARRAHGYLPTPEGPRRGPDEWIPLAPAGAMVASARDMAAFLRLHLGDGRVDGTRVLEADTVARMREPSFRVDPRMPGNAHGFWESGRHGERILTHGGDTQLMHAFLALLPERDWGLFLATNGARGALVREGVWDAFLDRFAPVDPLPLAPSDDPPPLGNYASNRVSQTTLGKVAALAQPAFLHRDDEGMLTFSLLGMPRSQRLVPQGPGLYRDAETFEMAWSGEDAQGRPVFVSGAMPMMAFRPTAPWNDPVVTLGVVGGCLLVLLSGVVGFPWQARRARREGRGGSGGVRPVGVAAATLLVVFVGGFVILGTNPFVVAYPPGPLLYGLLTVGVAGAVASGAFLLLTLWRWRALAPLERLHTGVVALSAVLLLAVLQHWNLLGYRF